MSTLKSVCVIWALQEEWYRLYREHIGMQKPWKSISSFFLGKKKKKKTYSFTRVFVCVFYLFACLFSGEVICTKSKLRGSWAYWQNFCETMVENGAAGKPVQFCVSFIFVLGVHLGHTFSKDSSLWKVEAKAFITLLKEIHRVLVNLIHCWRPLCVAPSFDLCGKKIKCQELRAVQWYLSYQKLKSITSLSRLSKVL